MATRKCRDCAAGCYLIPEQCLWEGSILKQGYPPTDLVLPHMRRAQDLYIRPLLGKDCMDTLCADITAYEDSSTPIPVASQALIDAVTPLLVAATALLYVRESGGGTMTQAGLTFPANFNAQAYAQTLRNMEATLAGDTSTFKVWLSDNRAAYPCLPGETCATPSVPDTGFSGGFDALPVNRSGYGFN